MRIAIVSDIHGNLPALQVLLDDVRRLGVDLTVNLGDSVSGPLWPEETAQLLRELAWPTLAGNHERQVLASDRTRMSPTDALTAQLISEATTEWMRSLPPTAWIAEDIYACHGTPTSDLGYLLETVTDDFDLRVGSRGIRMAQPHEVQKRLCGARDLDAHDLPPVILCGHTHTPRLMSLLTGGLLLNPGSLGLPAYDDEHPHTHWVETGSPHARYAVLERRHGRWSASLRCLNYDWEHSARRAQDLGRGDWADAQALELRFGPNKPTSSLELAMTMDDRDGKIWMDGQLVEWRDAKIHVLTHTLHYGCGVFEGVRAYKTQQGTAIFRLREHTERLFNSAKILRMSIPFSMEQVMQAQAQVMKANQLDSGYIRPLVWLGSEKMGVSPKGAKVHLMVAAWPWGAYLGEDGLKRGIRVKTSSYTRHHVNITMCNAKAVSNYTNSILANLEATEDGYDEALLLDPQGFVSEGAGENIFIVREGKVYTPDLSAGALNGITRNTVVRICQDLGLSLIEKRITRDEVYIADEAFFTGTAAEVTPIRELDRVQIGIGSRGPITEKIQNAFFDIVNGRNPKYAEWLSPL